MRWAPACSCYHGKMLRRAADRQRLFDKARKQAQSNVAAMRENALPIIATSSTCTFTLRDEYPHLLDVDNSDLRDRVELATRWIWKQLDSGKTAAAPAAAEGGLSPRAIWRKWAGRCIPSNCCG